MKEEKKSQESALSADDEMRGATDELGNEFEEPAASSEPAIDAEVEAEGAGTDSGVGDGDERDAKVLELQAQLTRTMADFDNFRRRTRQEREELQQYATKKLLADLLPVVDNFDRALASAADNSDAASLKSGVEMVQRQLFSVLQSFGVQAMETVGQSFDPNVHEAVMQEPGSGQEAGIVLQEFQKGYLLHDKVLRPAMVKVSV